MAQVSVAHPVDTTRVYVTGHSYGCVMAQRVLAQASDLVAAVACFSAQHNLANDRGVFPLTKLSIEYTPRPLMIVHGAADRTIPYVPADFPGPYFSLGAEKNLESWGGYNGCPGDVATEVPKDNYTLHEIDCNGVVSALVEVPARIDRWMDGFSGLREPLITPDLYQTYQSIYLSIHPSGARSRPLPILHRSAVPTVVDSLVR